MANSMQGIRKLATITAHHSLPHITSHYVTVDYKSWDSGLHNSRHYSQLGFYDNLSLYTSINDNRITILDCHEFKQESYKSLYLPLY